MPRVLTGEGTSGIIELKGSGLSETYAPDNDLDRALELLFALYEVKNAQGSRLRDNYRLEGFNWLSTQVGNLYWRWLFRLVQYGPLLQRFEQENLCPRFRNKLNLARIWEVLHPEPKGLLKRLWANWQYEHILGRHNREIARTMGGKLLFYRYGPKDFRTREMLTHFEERGVEFDFVYSPSQRLLKERAKQPHPCYFLHRKRPVKRLFHNEYDLSGFEPWMQSALARVIERAEEQMSFAVWEYRRHLQDLAPNPPKLLFGLEDHQEIYPLLYACRTLGVPSIGYQFSMYARRQAAYTFEGWNPGEYDGFDKVITWGPYWEKVIRKWSQVYPPGYYLPGANKHSYGYKRLDSPSFDTRNILVPYEFWGNTRRIGQYMVKLMDLGYTVYFKFKPDERPRRQLDCYELPEAYRSRVVEVLEITDELMAEINIVAGGMTTLLYDLLPYGKHTWVLDTEFTLLDDLVEDGWAEKVRYEDLESLPRPQKAEIHKDWSELFSSTPLPQVLDEQVLARL
ncbi:MAG: hypothetical protein KKE73_02060 [Proteobacteria bacterium]|nr:hypothetical protein [Pseudomonadota bacterium]